MNKLNVFYGVHYPWCSIWGIRRNIKSFFKSFKFAYQRITRGFCDADWWDMDSFYLSLISSSLKHFAENTISHPYEFSETEWKEKLLDLAQRIKYVSLDNDESNEYSAELMGALMKDETPSKELNDKYWERDREISNNKQEILVKAFEELAQIMPNLWD